MDNQSVQPPDCPKAGLEAAQVNQINFYFIGNQGGKKLASTFHLCANSVHSGRGSEIPVQLYRLAYI